MLRYTPHYGTVGAYGILSKLRAINPKPNDVLYAIGVFERSESKLDEQVESKLAEFMHAYTIYRRIIMQPTVVHIDNIVSPHQPWLIEQPNDHLAHIIAFLSIRERAMLTRVCRRLRECAAPSTVFDSNVFFMTEYYKYMQCDSKFHYEPRWRSIIETYLRTKYPRSAIAISSVIDDKLTEVYMCNPHIYVTQTTRFPMLQVYHGNMVNLQFMQCPELTCLKIHRINGDGVAYHMIMQSLSTLFPKLTMFESNQKVSMDDLTALSQVPTLEICKIILDRGIRSMPRFAAKCRLHVTTTEHIEPSDQICALAISGIDEIELADFINLKALDSSYVEILSFPPKILAWGCIKHVTFVPPTLQRLNCSTLNTYQTLTKLKVLRVNYIRNGTFPSLMYLEIRRRISLDMFLAFAHCSVRYLIVILSKNRVSDNLVIASNLEQLNLTVFGITTTWKRNGSILPLITS